MLLEFGEQYRLLVMDRYQLALGIPVDAKAAERISSASMIDMDKHIQNRTLLKLKIKSGMLFCSTQISGVSMLSLTVNMAGITKSLQA